MQAESELLPLLETLYASKNPTRRWLHRTRRDWICAKLSELANERSARALEVGFGAGVYLPTLAQHYGEVVASDLEDAHREHARAIAAKYPNLHLINDDITHSALPDHSFSLVLCSEVIEHISDGDAVLRSIHRLLEPGGLLLLSTPQRYSLIEIACKIAFLPGMISLARRVYREPVFETGHINLMTAGELTRKLENAGFKIRERFKSGMYVPLVAEFMGEFGLKAEQRIEQAARGRFDWILWTQYYVAEALPSATSTRQQTVQGLAAGRVDSAGKALNQ